MNLTVVIFKAFDKTSNECFIHGESDLQIHNALATICPTYVPLDIRKASDAEPVSLNTLLIYKI